MSQPTPGLQRRDTFGSLVHKMSQGRTLAVKYASIMVRKLRRSVPNEGRPNAHELTEVPLPPGDGVRDFKWPAIQALINAAGEKHVLVNFYTNKSKRCKRSVEIFQQLQTFVDPGKIILVKCNLDENHLPFEIYQLPTIKLYPGPGAQKQYTIEYFDNPLSLKGYLRFLRQEGSFLQVFHS